MVKTIDFNLLIESESILLFDMDGTLIDTDYANFLSYQSAIQSICNYKVNINYDPKIRFNRSKILSLFPKISTEDFNYIIKLKETNYINYIHHTKLISPISEILLKYYKTNPTILVTNCREDRAKITLQHHNIIDKFKNIFYRETNNTDKRVNKYYNCITKLNLPIGKIIAFENEYEEIVDALKAGISHEKIIRL